jgi:V/A-type H+-transporting ATPase subunit E
MALDDILAHIRASAEAEAEAIRRKAEEERARMLDRARTEAEQLREQLVTQARQDAEAEGQRELIRARSEEKKKLLQAKRDALSRAFETARDRFFHLPQDSYLSLFKEIVLPLLDRRSRELLVCPRDKELLESGLWKELRQEYARRGGTNTLTLKAELPDSERGFILRSEGMEVNRTLSTLFQTLRDELEIEVAGMLFSSESQSRPQPDRGRSREQNRVPGKKTPSREE